MTWIVLAMLAVVAVMILVDVTLFRKVMQGRCEHYAPRGTDTCTLCGKHLG